uniref:Zinc-ribbon domain-containing protein n=1 Tax=Noctiluca scintillans TaxID=2966 RepID=A0A7S1AIL2_NOCSC|mmetsp:Transcript_47813/g.126563  ORF Transcript_47813/g.126563 Transcript_47813/m.126563 type:complete len:249 (+) Transcript_47813:77-823(+)
MAMLYPLRMYKDLNGNNIVNCNPMPTMLHSGRIYQDPRNRQQIYVNFGWGFKGGQRYPEFETWMTEFVSASEYEQILGVLQQEMETVPYDAQEDERLFRLLRLAHTCPCVCLCTCHYVIQECREQQKFAAELLERANSKIKVVNSSVTLQYVIDFNEHSGLWTDSRNKDLMSECFRVMRSGGPPLGLNLVFNAPRALQWPPQGQAVTPQQNEMIAPQVLGSVSVNRFCPSCGTQVAGFKFCAQCGAQQ